MARRQRDVHDWNSVSIGIITFATILVAATSAGIFAISDRLLRPEQASYPEWLLIQVGFLAVISLFAYLAVLASGIAALFRKTQAAKRAEFRNTAIAVLLQAFTASVAAVLIILSPLLKEIDKLV